VYVSITRYGPEFPSALFLVTAPELPDPDDPAVIQALSRHLSGRILMDPVGVPSDAGIASISWLVSPDGTIERVVLDDDRLDDDPPSLIIDPTRARQRITWPPPPEQG